MAGTGSGPRARWWSIEAGASNLSSPAAGCRSTALSRPSKRYPRRAGEPGAGGAACQFFQQGAGLGSAGAPQHLQGPRGADALRAQQVVNQPVQQPVPLGGFAQALTGPPTDTQKFKEARVALMKHIAERQKKLVAELKKQQEDLNKMQPNVGKAEKKK